MVGDDNIEMPTSPFAVRRLTLDITTISQQEFQATHYEGGAESGHLDVVLTPNRIAALWRLNWP